MRKRSDGLVNRGPTVTVTALKLLYEISPLSFSLRGRPPGLDACLTLCRLLLDVMAETKEMQREAQRKYPFVEA
jgi:hypothetical protein